MQTIVIKADEWLSEDDGGNRFKEGVTGREGI